MQATLEFFAPLVGTEFTAETQAGPIALRLESCAQAPRRGLPQPLRTPLSLLFSGPAAPLLVQDNYGITHPAMARQTWTMAPVMPRSDRAFEVVERLPEARLYEVLFA